MECLMILLSLTNRSKDDYDKMVKAAGVIFVSQNTFGKKPEDLQAWSKAILQALDEYPASMVLDGLRYWWRNCRGIPETIDIRELLLSGKIPNAKDYHLLKNTLLALSRDIPESLIKILISKSSAKIACELLLNNFHGQLRFDHNIPELLEAFPKNDGYLSHDG